MAYHVEKLLDMSQKRVSGGKTRRAVSRKRGGATPLRNLLPRAASGSLGKARQHFSNVDAFDVAGASAFNRHAVERVYFTDPKAGRERARFPCARP
jgi:hypothetical protein